MKKISEPIVFFGSGPVAAEALRLLARDFNIEAIVTKPKPVHHRGNFPVLTLAKEHNLPILTASNKSELDSLFTTSPVTSRLAILIDFGIIVPQTIIDYFPLGIINSHFSILPEWRGADPISFAILSGQEQTGVSLMLLVEKMDEGPLLGYGEYTMPPDITAPQLTDYLIKLSHALLVKEVPRYLGKESKTAPQTITGRQVSYSRKLTKQDGVIDWHKPAEQIEREIRAYIEWPKSRTTLAGKDVIITKAVVASHQPSVDAKIGQAFVIPDKQLVVQTGDGVLIIKRLKPAGRQEMAGEAFLQGYGL
jgi:methionyl-tRNA formyltransferase